MSVRKNTRGRWMVDAQIQAPHGSKIRIRKVSPVQSRRGAERYERRLRKAVMEGTQRRVDGALQRVPTVAEYVQPYLRDLDSRGRKPTTLSSTEGLLRNWITPRVGGRSIDAVKTVDFSVVRQAMTEAGRNAKTINNALVVLSGMVRHWHVEHDISPPAFRVGLVKVAKCEAPFYTDEESDALVAAAGEAGPDIETLVLFGVDGGLRMSEIRALRWSDLALLGRATVTVSRTREGDEEYPPKGWASRVIPLTGRLVAALGGVVRRLCDPHVLLDRWGQPLTRRMVDRRFRKVKRAAGIMHGTFHTTRHTFCTTLAARGVPPKTIQELAGHADLSTTMRYLHATPGATDAAIAALERRPETSLTEQPRLNLTRPPPSPPSRVFAEHTTQGDVPGSRELSEGSRRGQMAEK
ncbi:MAG: site-specific integrase [Deltaproteobacteria bacterium]|nr:site-specific integrase [Deltaproteobacteria bacterium]